MLIVKFSINWKKVRSSFRLFYPYCDSRDLSAHVFILKFDVKQGDKSQTSTVSR